MPKVLQSYLPLCFLWSLCSLSGTSHLSALVILAGRKFLCGRHYGELCRAISMWTVVLAGTLSCIPTPLLYTALAMEAWSPTMGGDEAEQGGHDVVDYVPPSCRLAMGVHCRGGGLIPWGSLSPSTPHPRHGVYAQAQAGAQAQAKAQTRAQAAAELRPSPKLRPRLRRGPRL